MIYPRTITLSRELVEKIRETLKLDHLPSKYDEGDFIHEFSAYFMDGKYSVDVSVRVYEEGAFLEADLFIRGEEGVYNLEDESDLYKADCVTGIYSFLVEEGELELVIVEGPACEEN